jgi:glucosylceramidase
MAFVFLALTGAACSGATAGHDGASPGDASPDDIAEPDVSTSNDGATDSAGSDGATADAGNAVDAPFAATLTISSAAGDRLTTRPAPAFQTTNGPGTGLTVVVDPGVADQIMDGFGASFLEAGMVCLNTLSTAEQDRVLTALFDRDAGAGFSLMKTVIGGTDFQSASPDWYTYDDVPGDTQLASFSIARDLGPSGLVTYIKRARAAGGQFLLEAPMDYAPDWMMVDASDPVSGQIVPPENYDLLAQYQLDYLQAYEAEGVHVDYLAPFNEPLSSYSKNTFESERDIIRDHLGPLLAREHVTTHLMAGEAWTRAWAGQYLPVVLDDPGAAGFVAVAAYHGYDFWLAGATGSGYDQIAQLHQSHPGVPLWMTELCCEFGLPSLSFEEGVQWAQILMSDVEAGASAWVYWNMILDENGGPWLVSSIHDDRDGNAQNALVQINRATHEVTFSGLYYFLAHFSKFVRPGAQRIRATLAGAATDTRALAFRNANKEGGTFVLELLNPSGEDRPIRVQAAGRELDLTLPAVSISTLTWK